MSDKDQHIIRGYYVSHKAWYKNVVKDPEIVFGHYIHEYGGDYGTTGEMSVKWEELNFRMVPCLHCFDDAWKALASFKDVLDKMAEVDDQTITPEQLAEILNSCGFLDLTKYKSPYED